MSTYSLENCEIRSAKQDDIEAVVNLLNICSIERVGSPQVEMHEIHSDWHAPNFNLSDDTRVVFAPNGRIVGYAVLWYGKPHVRINVTVDVHPEHRGKGIGTVISQWAETRARHVVMDAPKGTQTVMLQKVLSTDALARDFLRQQGYHLAYHVLCMVIEMNEPPPEPSVPVGFGIRPFIRGQEERALILASREAFRDHWGYVENPFEEMYEEWMHWIETDPEVDPSLWFVAVEGEEIAGVVLCRPRTVQDPDMGYIMSLGVRRPWRRRGLGLALLHYSFGTLYRRGRRRVGLDVDAQNLTGAVRLYERAGMHVQHQYAYYEKELRPGKDLSIRFMDP